MTRSEASARANTLGRLISKARRAGDTAKVARYNRERNTLLEALDAPAGLPRA